MVVKEIIVAEAQTFIYACRATGPQSARIFSVKKEVALAAIPSAYTRKVINFYLSLSSICAARM